jgi:acyl-coenzyme A synthetase/AMP-(fatty) acid ligase
MLGIMRAGGVVVPIHARNAAETSTELLNQVRPRCVLYHPSVIDEVDTLRGQLGSVQEWIDLRQAALGGTARVPPDRASLQHWVDPEGNPSRPVYYWSTSGSTGTPKIVVDVVRTFETALTIGRLSLAAKSDRHVSLVLAPMSHAAGPRSLTVLSLGGTLVVMRSFEAGRVLDQIERHAVTDMWLPPTGLYLLLSEPGVRRRNLSSLRNIQLGTAAVSPPRLREAVDVLGPCIAQSYGQIETGFVTMLDAATVASAAGGDRAERLSSSGRMHSVNRVAIMAPEGELLPPGEQGEIVVRGGAVKSYLDPAATAAARAHGWHHTGDLGRIDSDGFLYVAGRVRDVVNMAGYKIPAAEVERVAMELTEVQECAAVAAPDAVRGEVVKLIVVMKPGLSIRGEEIVAHCRRRLGHVKGPMRVEQWSTLPRSPAGKIDKIEIRNRLWYGTITPTP